MFFYLAKLLSYCYRQVTGYFFEKLKAIQLGRQ